MEKEFIVETRPTGRERELTEGRTSEVSSIWIIAQARALLCNSENKLLVIHLHSVANACENRSEVLMQCILQ